MYVYMVTSKYVRIFLALVFWGEQKLEICLLTYQIAFKCFTISILGGISHAQSYRFSIAVFQEQNVFFVLSST